MDLTVFHGTPHKDMIEKFNLNHARALTGNAGVDYAAGGEHVQALADVPCVWASEAIETAEQYHDYEGLLYEIALDDVEVAEIEGDTDAEMAAAVADAIADGAQVLSLVDRDEVMILDADCIRIVSVQTADGEWLIE